MKKVTLSVYIDQDLRSRLVRHAAKQQEKTGERVSLNSVIISALEAWLASYDGGGSGEKGEPTGSPDPDQT